MLTITQLWKTPSTGMSMSTMSGIINFTSGKKIRSVALPIGPSSAGGRPTTIDWNTGFFTIVIVSTCSAGNGSTGV